MAPVRDLSTCKNGREHHLSIKKCFKMENRWCPLLYVIWIKWIRLVDCKNVGLDEYMTNPDSKAQWLNSQRGMTGGYKTTLNQLQNCQAVCHECIQSDCNQHLYLVMRSMGK